MHQQSRHPPRVSSPASSPKTNPTRTNNQREAFGLPARSRAGSEATSQDGSMDTSGSAGTGPSRESIKKLDQIVQNFYLKASVLILQSRINIKPTGKRSKWFQIETDDTDDFKRELQVYKTSGSFDRRPPPMIIETYLDASRLSSSQSLVVVDEYGKRWDVLEALNASETSSDESPKRRQQKRNTEVVLERWRIELKCIPTGDREEFGPNLPTIYKKSIVFFRSLFVATRIMPCWKYSQQALAKGIHPALEVKCRVLQAEPEYRSCDLLRQPLYDGRDVVTDYVFGDLEVPVGRFYASVTYRNDCSFRVDDSESLLSSRFMGVDETFFKPSIAQRPQPGRSHARSGSYAEPGSLPSRGQVRSTRGAQEPQQTYGSLSTFHGAGAPGTSPISALKAVRPIGSDTSSAGSTAASIDRSEPSHSLPIRDSGARPTLRNLDGTNRRPSVSFQPFKAGSLSGSPRIPDGEVPASPQSYSRPSGLSGHAKKNSSLTAGMAASLRGGPPSAPQDVPQTTGSPKPGSRYSSSFSHRRGRPSFGGQSKGDDEGGSSGKQSLSSSAQPGSGLLAEAGGVASSGSFATDDDNISDFLKALDSRKTLQSFEPNKKGESSAAKRTAAQLSKFQMMRESNNMLTESMTSSAHLQRSSTTSSRQLTNVPNMINPASMSTSSSPGKPLSPHTPHTPAIPSRLSENSIIDYQGQPTRRQSRRTAIVATEEEGSDHTPVSQEGTTAIDIPLSPRLLHTGNTNRRASSVAQQHRSLVGGGEDDPDLGQRSISLGADDRGEAPTLSTLLTLQRNIAAGNISPASLQPAADIRASPGSGQESLPETTGHDKGLGLGSTSASPAGLLSEANPYRGVRYMGRARPATPGSSRGSFSQGRYRVTLGGGEDGADDEPLLFAMSELERPSRRSLEEGRGGGARGGLSGVEREREREREGEGGFEPRGVSRRGW
ncbi:autophagy-related protein 13-domain-containing protein [Lasiosphaeria hispida]|uniref:Autophagy-related protein 13 n=1 Tax=Lasiosphaeria hispida TaxID=260671 RepID=A0AAJ0MCE8_9PEZI|nr:autophagy-related protein 13-domain-containing protein [Lasiosphaeria hispida]